MPTAYHPDLSARENEVLELASRGSTDTAIAHRLGISEATVNTYWGRIRSKLGPMSRTELVALAIRTRHRQVVETLRHRYEDEPNDDPAIELEGVFREVVRHAPDAMLVVSEASRILFANDLACELFGYMTGELDGTDLDGLIPVRFRASHTHRLGEYFEHPDRRYMGEHSETVGVRRDGSELNISATLATFHSSRGTLATCIIREERQEDGRPMTGAAGW